MITGATRERLEWILECALQAPSADNHHPVVFDPSGETIAIRSRGMKLPGRGRYMRILELLSLGALVENLVIAASRFGLATDTRLMPDPDDLDLLVECRLDPGAVSADPLCSSIPLRHTSRAVLFRGPPMSDVEQAELADSAHAQPGCDLHWFDSGAARRRVLGLMRRAETERFRSRVLHGDLFSAIRFDVGWSTSCAEGLPPGCLGVEKPFRPLFAALRHWPVMRAANAFGAHLLLGVRSSYLPARLAPHLGLLAVADDDHQSVFDAGRAFERLWLTVTAQGRVLQPMPAAALYAQREATAEGIPEALRDSLAQAWREILGEAMPVMLFRLGFSPPPAVVTGRRPLAEHLAR